MESLDLKETSEIPKSNYNKDILSLSEYIKKLIFKAKTATKINYSYEDGINLLYESRAFVNEINKIFENLKENGIEQLSDIETNKISFNLLNLLEINDNRTNKYLFDIIKTIIIKECKDYGINTEFVK